MKILLVSATVFEITPLLNQFREMGLEGEALHFTKGELQLEVLITGVGLPLAAFALAQRLAQKSYDLLLQAGVAGAIDRSLQLGDVVEVVSDCFADLGVEEADGSFTNVTEMGLVDGNAHPFRDGRLWNEPEQHRQFLPQVHGLSVNKVHGTDNTVKALRLNYPFAQVESMEGAAFFYASLQYGLPALQVRAISNYVEKRQRENWELPTAIARLNEVIREMLLSFAD